MSTATATTEATEIAELNEYEFTIAVQALGQVRKDIAKATKITDKLGLPAPVLTVGDETFTVDQMHTPGGGVPPWKTGLVIECVEITITTPAFNLPGWRLVASIDLDEAGNIVGKFPAFQEVDTPDEWHSTGDRCDHCNVRRGRKSLVAVQSIETGEFKVVGKSCLAEYVGYVDAFELVKLAARISQLRTFDPIYGSGFDASATVVGFVSAAVGIVDRFGFTPGGVTRDLVRDFCFSNKHRKQLIEDGVEVGDDEITKAEKMVEWAKGQNGCNDYMTNMAIAARRPVASEKTFGLLASLPSAYQRAMGWEAERKAKADAEAVSEHIGNVKDRVELTATVVASRVSDGYSYYGPDSLWLKLVTAEGNVIIWKTNTDTGTYSLYASEELKAEGIACGAGTLSEGDKITGKATIKAHDNYQGTAQTVVTRWAYEIVTNEEA